MYSEKCKRKKYVPVSDDINLLIREANDKFSKGEYLTSFDIYEYIIDKFPNYSIAVLADLYDKYQRLPERNRYNLYQARIFDFNIAPGEKVLDVGSGHHPFPFATHLSDITTTDNNYGRAGVPFKYVEGKPVFEFNVENIPFEDKEFENAYWQSV